MEDLGRSRKRGYAREGKHKVKSEDGACSKYRCMYSISTVVHNKSFL